MLRNWGHWGHREHGVAAEDEAKRAEETARERQVREEAERDKLAIADAWERFPYTENTRGRTKPRLSERTVRDNASHWGTFATWAEEQGIRAVEDITEDHTAAFSRDLRDRMTANRRNKIIFTCSVVCRLPKRFEETRGPFAKVDSYELDPVHRENLEPDEIRQVIGPRRGSCAACPLSPPIPGSAWGIARPCNGATFAWTRTGAEWSARPARPRRWYGSRCTPD